MNKHSYVYSPLEEAKKEKFEKRMTIAMSIISGTAFAVSFCQWFYQW